ncbi:LOW QUALITY PROTEIN: hypothetical protein HID58_096342 [Brassica napus]|uniref:Uncharacterized protein n=1 Tax=Brassica napus TaxID=3708 RepID=A0ABQ7X0P5_BRANA|nr:LOW QUALITY PROTEIN: hypothetical protein HID58_096342 [Brassica napus]
MEILPAYEGLAKIISAEDDIRTWCFQAFQSNSYIYTSTAILSQVHLYYDEEKIGSGGGDDMAMEVGKGEVEVAKEVPGCVARAEVDPRLISPP